MARRIDVHRFIVDPLFLFGALRDVAEFGKRKHDRAHHRDRDADVEQHCGRKLERDRKSVVQGKRVSDRVGLGGSRSMKKKKRKYNNTKTSHNNKEKNK